VTEKDVQNRTEVKSGRVTGGSYVMCRLSYQLFFNEACN